MSAKSSHVFFTCNTITIIEYMTFNLITCPESCISQGLTLTTTAHQGTINKKISFLATKVTNSFQRKISANPFRQLKCVTNCHNSIVGCEMIANQLLTNVIFSLSNYFLPFHQESRKYDIPLILSTKKVPGVNPTKLSFFRFSNFCC